LIPEDNKIDNIILITEYSDKVVEIG